MLMRATVAPLPPAVREPSACSICAVRSRALFSSVPEGQLERAAAAVTHLRFEPGETVFAQGDTAGAVFTLRRGIVRFERASSDGQRRIMRLAGVGSLIGQEAMVRRPYAEDAVACTPVEVCRIPRAAVEDFGAREPAILRELMQRWQAALEAAGEWTAELTRGTARRRVLKLLDQLQQLASEGEIWLPSRPEMADMLGIATETASRVVSRLRREGVIVGATVGHARLDAQRLASALRAADL